MSHELLKSISRATGLPWKEQVAGSAVTVTAAVEKYLAGRGIGVTSSVRPSVSAAVVDRFLSSRSNPGKSSDAGCGCALPAPPPPQAPAIAPPAPKVEIVDFVCENDVREAIRHARKIYIGPKSIVTPAAREAAGSQDILVLAQR